MIEGFRVRVTHAELEKHCLDRSAYHHDRADTKEKELPALKESYERVTSHNQNPDIMSGMNKTGMSYRMEDPIPQLEQDIRHHRNLALVFGFYAGHLFDEDYNLTADNLRRLEIIR